MRIATLSIALAAITLVGCTRVETGEVGLRQKFDKTFETDELQPGSFNQVIVGDVFTFKVQDVAVETLDLNPLAQDNSTMKDVDVLAVYSINPKAVSELWTSKNKSFHTVVDGDILLMNNYVKQVLRNATYKAVRPYEALKMADNRPAIETAIRESMTSSFKEEGLDTAITVSQVQVRNITPADAVTASANELVRAQNELKTKTIEVQTAGKEAERINALNAKPKAIEYMNAQATLMIAQAALAGKVHTVVIPYDFKGIVNVGGTGK